VILCHGVRDLKKQHYESHVSDLCQGVRDLKKQHYESHVSDLCHAVRDLKKQHYESHESDPMSWSKRSEETTLRVTCE
jgi:hypothetical protein